MSVWLCLPSARPLAEAEPILKAWKDKGYRVAVWRDEEAGRITWADIERSQLRQGYPGYALAVNFLVNQAMLMDSEAEWFVAAGDDTLPDAHDPLAIATSCWNHFYIADDANSPIRGCGNFGVMQPTGDRWHEGKGGFTNAPIDRVCGSPWIGREFCRRVYGGRGPLWPEFQHMYVDEHLQNVASKLGILWQRRDLVHKHLHWGRGATDDAVLNDPTIPEHLERWNTTKHWQESKAIFERLKAGGFREAEDLL